MRDPNGQSAEARAGRIVFLLVGFSLMSYFNRTILSIAGPSIRSDLGLSETELGACLTAFQISYALFMVPGGWLADRFGPRWTLAAMGVGSAVFTAATALGGGVLAGAALGVLPSFLAVRLLLGMFTAPLYPTCARANARWVAEPYRTRVQGWIAAGAGLGAAIAPLLFGWLIDRCGWRTSFGIAGVATVALTVVWLALTRERRRAPSGAVAGAAKPRAAPGPAWLSMLKDRSLIFLTLGYIAVGYFDYVYFYWLYPYLKDIRGLGDAWSRNATAVVHLTWMVLAPLGGWLSDRCVRRYGVRWGQRVVPMVSLTLSGTLLCVAINTTDRWATLAALALSFGCAGAADGSYWAAAIRAGGVHVAAACAVMNTGCNLWGGLSPLLSPIIAERYSWSGSLYVASSVLSVAVVSWLFVGPSSRIGAGSSPRRAS